MAILVTLLFCLACSAFAVPDFTFIHISDTHAPSAQSRDTIKEIATLGPVQMTPYNITSDVPSFVIMTGDMTEFGYSSGWETYLSYWKDVKIPIYQQSGNHDNTWDCTRDVIRALYGNHSYSFDMFGCRFISLDTATPQDPRPSITREQIDWLREDLSKLSPETPIFLFFHHPLGISEFSGLYERDLLVDLLRPYNVVLMLAGHGHKPLHMDIAGIDLSMTGAAIKSDAGYSIVSLKDNTLRVAFKKAGEKTADMPILEKPLPTGSDYPHIDITSPVNGETYRSPSIDIRISVTGTSNPVKSAGYTIDDFIKGSLTPSSAEYTAAADTGKLTLGAHYLRVTLTDDTGKKFQRSTSFYVENGSSKALWRVFAKGSCKGAAAIAGDSVYTGATDGRLYAFRKDDGTLKWTFETGGEILSQPLVAKDTVYFGSGDGRFYALDLDGKPRWSFKTRRPVYSSPVIAGDKVLFGGNDSRFYALNAPTGILAWVNTSPTYTIESKPFVDGDTVYFGAWDTYVYAVDVATGKLKWKSKSRGPLFRWITTAKYYSPADCGPVVFGGRLFVADRDYKLSIMETADGHIVKAMDKCSAVGLSQDGKSIYIRRTFGDLTKADLEGKVIWSVRADMDVIPAPPTERDGVVYICTKSGRVKALSAKDGSLLWEYQSTPGAYVFSDVEAQDGTAYVTGMDGSLTAIAGKVPGNAGE